MLHRRHDRVGLPVSLSRLLVIVVLELGRRRIAGRDVGRDRTLVRVEDGLCLS